MTYTKLVNLRPTNRQMRTLSWLYLNTTRFIPSVLHFAKGGLFFMLPGAWLGYQLYKISFANQKTIKTSHYFWESTNHLPILLRDKELFDLYAHSDVKNPNIWKIREEQWEKVCQLPLTKEDIQRRRAFLNYYFQPGTFPGQN